MNVVQNQIETPTFLHSNEHHSHSTTPNELNPIGIDRQILKVQTFQILDYYIKISPTYIRFLNVSPKKYFT